MTSRQERLDSLSKSRRETRDQLNELSERAIELDTTIARFVSLEEVYLSDLQRLNALEEGGAILVSRLDRSCPVCGALPKHQLHSHAADEIRMAHAAAKAEVRSIQRDRAELKKTTVSLAAELEGVRIRIRDLEE
jgi:DNA repair exonuclease SbcCD ATPase subunit